MSAKEKLETQLAGMSEEDAARLLELIQNPAQRRSAVRNVASPRRLRLAGIMHSGRGDLSLRRHSCARTPL